MSEDVVLVDDGGEVKRKPSLAEVEAIMKQTPGQLEIPVSHIFSGGVYIRQIDIPAGAVVMGKRHRRETCNILLKGTLAVYVEEGKPPMNITGPAIFTSPPYAKKFALCREDAVFLNVIPTDETDPEKIEELTIIPEDEYLALQAKEETKCLS